MSTYNFNKELFDIQGEAVLNERRKPAKLNFVLADIFSQKSTDNFMKFIPWALELGKSGKLTIDKADRDLIKDTLKSDKNTIDLVKYYISEVLDNPESEEVK